MKDSFKQPEAKKYDVYTSEDSDAVQNSLIEKEMKYLDMYGPAIFPSIVINNQTFRGQFEIESVFNAICAGFKDTPRYCRKYLMSNNFNDPDLILMNHRNHHSYFKVFSICLFIVLTVFLMLCCYRRYAKREMKEQVNQQIESAVHQYLALSNADKEAGNRANRSINKVETAEQQIEM